MDHLKKLIREVPDFPKAGINFYDITTLLKHPQGLRDTVDALAKQFEGTKVDAVVGIEARGFIFAPALATISAPGSFRCASLASFRLNARPSHMNWNMDRTRLRSIVTQLVTDIESLLPTTCWQQAELQKRLRDLLKGWADR